ncbi:sortase [Candidatus Uhrbacteria bacterium]|nr:sortase [Candidatus Uhrbacteria bacterium]
MKRLERQSARPPLPVFISTTVVLFFLSLSAADSVGFVPCYVDDSECGPRSVSLGALPELGEEPLIAPPPLEVERLVLPDRILIADIALDLPVQNPETRDIAALDELLKKGPIRYVDSAKLGENGNVLIFAHTSHLPVVKNQMYKAFNRIPELAAGDSITLEGEGESGAKKTYLYTVTSVRQVDAKDASVDLSAGLGKKLTLVTCDTLTGKTARFLLEADFVASF